MVLSFVEKSKTAFQIKPHRSMGGGGKGEGGGGKTCIHPGSEGGDQIFRKKRKKEGDRGCIYHTREGLDYCLKKRREKKKGSTSFRGEKGKFFKLPSLLMKGKGEVILRDGGCFLKGTSRRGGKGGFLYNRD